MKNLILLLIILIASKGVSQDFNKVYFDSKWRITSKQNSSFYRISAFSVATRSYDGKVTDFFADGVKEMTGEYKNGLKEGEFLFFHHNGNIRLRSLYSGNQRVGSWTEYYSNGMVKANCTYSGNQETVLALNDSLGKSIIEKNHFTLIYNFFEDPVFDKDGVTIERNNVFEMDGYLKNSMRDGKWLIKKNNLNFAILSYSNGNLVKGNILPSESPVVHGEILLSKDQFVFPIISDPEKFQMTETFRILPGVPIKNNYILDGLREAKLSSLKKIILKDEIEVVEYIMEHFDLRSRVKANVVQIVITTESGRIADFTTIPIIPLSAMKDLKLILNSIEKFDFPNNKMVTIDYEVPLENQIK